MTALQIGKTIWMGFSGRSFAAVVGLCLRKFPSHIAGGVRAIVVDAPDCVTVRTRPQVGVEVLERLGPTLADSDPAPAVRRVFWITGIKASLLHRSPRIVFAGMAHVVGAVVRRLAFWVADFASAALRVPASERVGTNGHLVSAVAFRQILMAVAGAMGVAKNSENPVSVGRQGARLVCHDCIIAPIRGEFA